MLYYLDDADKKNLRMVKRTNLDQMGWLEQDLEELLSNNIERLLDEQSLMPIFRQRRMQEEPDIMALDKEGTLYIFELKRWKSSSENLLQVLRYGQIFGSSTYEKLEELFKIFNPSAGELLDEHERYFNLQIGKVLKKEQFNRKQHFLVVTDGTDRKTREAINYWKTTGLNIDSIVYRVYHTDSGEKLLELNTYSPEQDVIETEQSSYVLNTNFSNNQASHHDMLDKGKAAAYYAPWKYKINRIQKGDRVFLYQSGKGIVAVGTGTGVINKETYKGESEEEYNTPLWDFKRLKKPVTAAEMKEITESNYMFAQTMFSIDEKKSDLLWGYIHRNCIES
ncbi:EVE domain-containing protein [Bacillus marinisedimentorum]|uniref:EVE domain-containing protein n=1 Tax=Bacillus marinisedimentorum TaxID=1821260 RepID=UPI0009F72CD4|nr:EVE domain-containing protein [Bacillus marinisedimentorum]